MFKFKDRYTKKELSEIAKTPEVMEFFIENHRDFINAPKYDYSLSKCIKDNEDGCNQQSIIKMLNLKNIEELELIYSSAIKKLRQALE